MRRLIFGALLAPLLVALIVALVCVENALGSWEPPGESNFEVLVAGAGGLAFVTVFLVARHPASLIAFHWLYLLGLLCLCFALAAALHDIGREYPYDPYNQHGFKILSRVVAAASTVVLGLLFLAAAVLQDFMFPQTRPQRPNKAIQRIGSAVTAPACAGAAPAPPIADL
jgi:hypothetical protein